jgi:hypothetical protein
MMRTREGEAMAVIGRLEVEVGGERWRPVKTLARCGPEDRCFVLHVETDGRTTVQFGDGVTGKRPPAGEEITVTYRHGAGQAGEVPPKQTPVDPDETLVDLFVLMGDLLSRSQDQVASEAYVETASGRSRIVDPTELRKAIAASEGEFGVCIRFHAKSSQHHSAD